jgi:hypothetical protein
MSPTGWPSALGAARFDKMPHRQRDGFVEAISGGWDRHFERFSSRPMPDFSQFDQAFASSSRCSFMMRRSLSAASRRSCV